MAPAPPPPLGGEVVGRVQAVFSKPRKGGPVVPARELACRRGEGIVGDANASPHSPRQVLLVSAEQLAGLGLAAGELWENVTTAGLHLEGLGSGALLEVGTAVLALTYECEPCRMMSGLTGRSLRQLVGRRGMVGVVAAGGVVAPGDAVRLLPDRLPPLPRSYLARCRLVVSQVPAGRALTYEQLNLAVGGPGALVRILPRWLPRLAAEGLPAHRVVASYEELLEPGQARRLAAEGVPLSAGRLVPGPPWWSAEAWLLERDGAGAGNVPAVANPDVPGATAAGPPRR